MTRSVLAQLFVVVGLCIAALSPIRAQSVRLRTEAVDQVGNPISAVQVGDPFFLDLRVTDVRPTGTGVFAAYADIAYDASTVQADGTVLIEGNGLGANHFLAGLIDEAGSFDGFFAPGPAERTFARFPFHATNAGLATFSLTAAGQYPIHATLFYDPPAEVPLAEIEFIGNSITVVPEPSSILLGCVGLTLTFAFAFRKRKKD